MGINRPTDRSFFVIGGAVKTSGGSLDLVKGQLALVDGAKTTSQGAKVLSTLAGVPKNNKFLELRLGIDERQVNRTYSNKPMASMPFSLNEIVDLKVSAPKRTEMLVDEVILGYNGIDDSTSFNLNLGDVNKRITVEIYGDAVSYLGGGSDKEIISINFEVPRVAVFDTCNDDEPCGVVDCKEWTLNVIETFKNHQLVGGTKLGELIEITPVLECDTPADETLIPYDFYTLSLCDTGDAEALALVKAQYPDVTVARIGRSGSTSTYQMLIPQADGAPDDYVSSIASILKGCSACPAGYTEVPGGVIYAITIEDDGDDLTSTIQALPNAVSGTATKATGQDAGIGFYTVVLTTALTDAQITTFLAAGDPNRTATFENAGTVASLCSNSDTTEYTWVVGETCNAVERQYLIDLPDTECGTDRLTELQLTYPDLTIAIAEETGVSQAITLTGTGGTANVTIDGTNYLATFATSLTVTAANFVTAHAAAIYAAHGMYVTAALGVLTFTGLTENFETPSIANATTNLAGTVATAGTSSVDIRRGCATRYVATVLSNLVCDECDPIFLDSFTSEAPGDYDTHVWVESSTNSANEATGNCKCGIRFKSKPFILSTGECFRDRVNFREDSLRIRVAGGYPEEVREGIGKTAQEIFSKTVISKFEPRTHLGGNLQDFEDADRLYFTGATPGDSLKRYLRGMESSIQDQTKQYVDYAITISHFSHSGSFAGRINEDITYHVFVEVGRHNAVENLLNALASAAGVSPVSAFGA